MEMVISCRGTHIGWVLFGLVVGGCSEPEIPDFVIESQASPFYWYQDTTRIYLRVDSTRVTVETDAARVPALSALLASLGVAVDSSTAMTVMPEHWVLWLHHGTSLRAAEMAAGALRTEASVRFASNAYLFGTLPTECTLLFINRLAVMYEASTTEGQIAAFHKRAGLDFERVPSGPLNPWWLRYPTGSSHTPLEIAATVYQYPYVDWADPDNVGCVTTGGL